MKKILEAKTITRNKKEKHVKPYLHFLGTRSNYLEPQLNIIIAVYLKSQLVRIISRQFMKPDCNMISKNFSC